MSVQLYLLEVDRNKTEAKNIAEQTARQLEKKELKLIDFITGLNEYINRKDDNTIRANTVAYLAEVLTALERKTLSNQERRLLCDFILGRIEGDLEGIGSSAKALIALEAQGRWDATIAKKVVRTFVDHANPLKQFKTQNDRYTIIQLIDLCMAKYRNAIEEMQEDSMFLPSFIMLFEGEKDPRNLMIVFSLLQVPMTEWNIHSHAQDLFEAVFNYFPITFKPPPDDPYGITAQDLKDRLRQCISATSDFAPHAFPALLDKLDSSSMNTKRDVLHAMQDCVARYEPQTINLYSVTLWDALKFEILTPQEDDLAQGALRILGLIAARLGDAQLNAYLRPIIKECNEHLEDAPTKQSQAAGSILHAVASGSPQTADKLVQGILPTLFDLYKSTESISKRRGLLEVLNEILRAFVETQAAGDVALTEGLQPYGKISLEAFLRALTHAPKAEVSFRLISLQGLVQLTKLTILTEEEINRIIDTVTDLILHERVPGHGDIKKQAIEHLVQIAHTRFDLVQARSIPAFMVQLPDVPENAEYATCLEAFAQLSSERQIFDVVVLRLKSKYNAARHQGASEQYQQDLLKAILYAFVCGSPIKEDGAIRTSYFTQFVEPLLEDIQDAEIVGRICNCLLRDQTPHFQRSVYNERRDLLTDLSKAPLLLHFYAALRPEVVEYDDVILLLRSISHTTPDSSLIRLTTLLVNKYGGSDMQKTLRETGLEADSLLSNEWNLGLAFAAVKALVLHGKNAAMTKAYLQRLLSLLPKATTQQAHLFETILAPDELLTKSNHCNISGLYKQRTFSQLVPQIVKDINTNDTSKHNYLTALSGVLQWLPYTVLQPTLYTLVTSLLQMLDSPDTKLAALIVFENVLMHDPQDLSTHASSLINRLLGDTNGKDNAAVRAKALQCLAIIPGQLKRETVIPYRREVVKQLLRYLDDPKRSVRLEGVKCRTAWLGLEEADKES